MKNDRLPGRTGIFGVGVDLCHIPRLEKALPRVGRRAFTAVELKRARSTARAGEYLAGRWAAKEAFLKALGTGISGFITMKTIHIGADAKGLPVIRLERAAAARLKKIGAGKIHLSITHAGEYAMALVVVEKRR